MVYPGKNRFFHFGRDIISQFIKVFGVHLPHGFSEVSLPDFGDKFCLGPATETPGRRRVVVNAVFPAEPFAVRFINAEAGAPFAVFRAIGAGQADRFKVAFIYVWRLSGYPDFCLGKAGMTVAISPLDVRRFLAVWAHPHEIGPLYDRFLFFKRHLFFS
jgi:hypothetical protein